MYRIQVFRTEKEKYCASVTDTRDPSHPYTTAEHETPVDAYRDAYLWTVLLANKQYCVQA